LERVCRILDKLLDLLTSVAPLCDAALFARIFFYAVRVPTVDLNAATMKVVHQADKCAVRFCPVLNSQLFLRACSESSESIR
jgi:hypothetical protein